MSPRALNGEDPAKAQGLITKLTRDVYYRSFPIRAPMAREARGSYKPFTLPECGLIPSFMISKIPSLRCGEVTLHLSIRWQEPGTQPTPTGDDTDVDAVSG